MLGFRYAGLDGSVVESPEQARRVFREIVKDENVGVEVTRIMYQSVRPVIVRIPGPEGPSPTRRRLEDLIREAVGIKL